ncbi:gamma-glutamylcyclotransferase [Hoeflea prorocentri]|uniref:glutathione-specific gamma-glutamylcyclotransferase n=1 Tax=Hoeflea prorocentri TaxID=1922333 RepID=A0A9X3ZJB1_9HYPH|nr:gamma-glutamylcyclotransferase [Hoeflea prorocentri]MCY6382635.1 gamma-glutamylcyclotransferase [Hoeflea prorocentri]MDA5400435.1 gamma-glutamylcyclotransferase [Hoeflea prorocentri]
MTGLTDAFAFHPELRDRIADPMTSFMREITVDMLRERYPQLEATLEWVHSDSEREATRTKALAGRDNDDLWIFAYGSLMWDPALRFSEVRRTEVDGHARRFILLDDAARGSEGAPGLMAALDSGSGCEGLAFHIAAKDVDTETEILWRREMIGPGYEPRFVTARIDGDDIEALTFVADHDADVIRPDLSRAQQIECIAQGEGFLGTSRAYLANIVSQLDILGIHDADCARLLRDVDDFQAASAGKVGEN